MKSLYLFFFISLSGGFNYSYAQTKIISTNPLAEKIMLGNYNPITYKATKVLNLPDTITKGINKRISADSLKAYLEVLRTFKNRNTGSDTISKITGIGAARRCQRKPIGLALEQRYAEALLKKLHHPADRRRRDVQFSGGFGEAFGARGRLERPDAVEKWQFAHGVSPLEKLILRLR